MAITRVYKPTKFMLASSLKVDGLRVLDFGCGPGVLSALLSNRAREVVGVDHWPERIESARRLARNKNIKNIRFECLDARNVAAIQALGQFDVVICWGVLHRIADHVSLLHLLARLAPVICLEWHAPLFPFASKFRLGYFPRSSTLDKANLLGETNEKDQGDSKFWCPSIGAVQEILSQASFTELHLIGIGERLRGELFGTARACLGALKRIVCNSSLSKVPVARVYVTYTKEGAQFGIDDFAEWSTDYLPDWIKKYE